MNIVSLKAFNMSSDHSLTEVKLSSDSSFSSVGLPGLLFNLVLAFCHYLVGNILYALSSVVLLILKRFRKEKINDDDRKNIECFKMMSELCDELNAAVKEGRLRIRPKHQKRKRRNRRRQNRSSLSSSFHNNHHDLTHSANTSFDDMILNGHGEIRLSKENTCKKDEEYLSSSSTKISCLKQDDIALHNESSESEKVNGNYCGNPSISSNRSRKSIENISIVSKLSENFMSPDSINPSFSHRDNNQDKMVMPISKSVGNMENNRLDYQKLNDNNNQQLHHAIARDSAGYHNLNNISNQFSNCSNEQNESKPLDLLYDAESYNRVKDIELDEKIKAAQIQKISEINDFKTRIAQPPESMQFPQTKILKCPQIQNRKRMLREAQQKIDIFQNQIDESQKRSHDLAKTMNQTNEDGSVSIPSQLSLTSLVWQQKQESRINAAEAGIIRSVKFAMENRFHGMIKLKVKPIAFDGKNYCYDCASGRHKKYFIDGVDGCPIPKGPNILRESDGFKQDCIVVRIINSWYADVTKDEYESFQDKADSMEALFKRVRKETYIKRFYETGHLISQTYLTVSPHLHQFLVKNPKSSVPVLSD